jgi:hypothetical protein
MANGSFLDFGATDLTSSLGLDGMGTASDLGTGAILGDLGVTSPGLSSDVGTVLQGFSGLRDVSALGFLQPAGLSPIPSPGMPGVGGMVMRRMPPIVQSALAKIGMALGRRSVSIATATALAKRLGIPGLVALGLSIAEIAGLLLWHQTHKRRRMNVLNAKALRRSTRRLLGFERRAEKVRMALGGICRTRTRTKRGRCITCHRSPCICR